MTSTIDFDESTHIYSRQGIAIPSVTQLIKEAGLIDARFYTDWSADFGKYLHLACHYLALGKLDWKSLDANLFDHVRSFDRFLGESGFTVTGSEIRVFNQNLWVAGTFDLIGTFGGDTAIIDIKTNSIPVWAGVQTAGYAVCSPDIVAPRRFGLSLTKTGWNLREFSDVTDYDVFMACCSISNWKIRNKIGGQDYARNRTEHT